MIARDELGIPHVEAPDLGGLFFWQGLACAQDRLWQIAWDRARALGRVSELVGEPGIAQDTFARRLRLADQARAGYAALDAETRAALDSYAAGINAADGARAVELEMLGSHFEPWEPWQCIAVFLVRHVVFGAAWVTKLWRARVLATLGADAALAFRREGPPGTEVDSIVSGRVTVPEPDVDLGPAFAAMIGDFGAPSEDVDGGSNAWALSGARTSSGSPLLAGDPHRALESPNVYLQVFLRAPGIDACGLAFAGVPGIPHFGHVGAAAWCVTNAAADTDDVFVERFDQKGRYEFRGEWLDADRRTETIEVKGGGSVDVESVVTTHGPVVAGDPRDGAAIALCSSGLRSPGHGLAVIVPQLRARSADEIDGALARWVDPANNWLLADAEGNIAYRTAGHLPVRTEVNAWFPVPGWTGDHEWSGIRPHGSMPRLHNPAEGAIVTANQRIDGETLISPDFAGPGRARRIREILGSRDGLTTDDMAAIHRDDVTIPGLRLAKRVRGIACEGESARARDVLAGWDGRMSRGSIGAAVYAATRAALARATAAAHPRLATPPTDEPPGSMPPTPRLSTYTRAWPRDDATFAAALRDAWRELTETLGPDDSRWRWGALHVSRHTHGLVRVAPEVAAAATAAGVEVDGDGECVIATHSYPGVTYHGLQGPCARYVLRPGDGLRGAWVVPLGASGDPGSPHFADQQATWARGELLQIAHTAE